MVDSVADLTTWLGDRDAAFDPANLANMAEDVGLTFGYGGAYAGLPVALDSIGSMNTVSGLDVQHTAAAKTLSISFVYTAPALLSDGKPLITFLADIPQSVDAGEISLLGVKLNPVFAAQDLSSGALSAWATTAVATPVPEAPTALMLLGGIAGLLARRKRSD